MGLGWGQGEGLHLELVAHVGRAVPLLGGGRLSGLRVGVGVG